MTLDEAWKEAEDARPLEWYNGPLLQLFGYDVMDGGRSYVASANGPRLRRNRRNVAQGYGDTPVAALQALTAELRKRQ